MTNITPEAFCNDIAAQIAARRRQMKAAIVTRRQDQVADSSGHQERRSREDALRQRAEYLKSLAQDIKRSGRRIARKPAGPLGYGRALSHYAG
jgi:hypothetical protein